MKKWLPSEHAYIVQVTIEKNVITSTVFIILFLIFLDLENWNGTDRHHFNAIVSDQDLVEVYRKLNH